MNSSALTQADACLRVMPVSTNHTLVPFYNLEHRHLVNDTELLDLVLGIEDRIEDREISFKWRGMFQTFFQEERLRILAVG